MNKKVYDSYPSTIVVREFKIAEKIFVTTLHDHKKYHHKELAAIYKRRWEIEVNFRPIKTVMNMDMLSCKTPDMIKKEISIHFLAYNIIRLIMMQACVRYNKLPWKISFKGAIQLLNVFMPYFLNSSENKNRLLFNNLLDLIVKNRVGNRPGRIEPRKIKKRPKAFPTLKHHRSIDRQRRYTMNMKSMGIIFVKRLRML